MVGVTPLNPALSAQYTRGQSSGGNPGSTISNPASLAITSLNTIASYSAVAQAVAPASSATDIWELSNPSNSTRVVRVNRIAVAAGATAAALLTLTLLRRAAPSTGGTATAPTICQFDSGDGTAQAVAKAFTANPTPGTLVANLRTIQLSMPTIATGKAIWDLPLRPDGLSGIVLRPGEAIAINQGGVSAASGTLIDVDCAWTEE
jgi:hypothetical protein